MYAGRFVEEGTADQVFHRPRMPYTAGLLGEQYVGIDPGGSIDYLGAGSELQYTQSALVLEEVVGQFIFSKASEGG